jgi:hypothetical protein
VYPISTLLIAPFMKPPPSATMTGTELEAVVAGLALMPSRPFAFVPQQ